MNPTAPTGIWMRLTSERVVLVLFLSVGMCFSSALIAVRKVLQADPADVFS